MERRQFEGDDRACAFAARAIDPDPNFLPVEIDIPDSGMSARIKRDAVGFLDIEERGEPIFYVPMAHYRGVAMTVAVSTDDPDVVAAIVVLHHDDPHLTVPLFVSYDTSGVVARWEQWADVLNRPLIVRGLSGDLRDVGEDGFSFVTRNALPENKRPRAMVLATQQPNQGYMPGLQYDGWDLIARR